ncbi:MAG: FAD-dependent oxidoreductase [Aureispira sp.]
MEKAPVIIVGAGLAGSLMAIYLAQKGLAVEVFESRPDMRTIDISAGRSINLALSNRGSWALSEAGVLDKVMQKGVKMPGRMLHAKDGQTQFAPYGKDASQYISSISRAGLNQLLMTEAETYEQVNFHFNKRCIEVDVEQALVTVEDYNTKEQTTLQGATIIGGDGANSSVRQAMEQQLEGYQAQVDWLAHGYKELSIPPTQGQGFALDKNALHIWPRGDYMLIALPNADGSFTCTLFFPYEGNPSFESLDSPEKVQAFFEEEFGDAVPHLTNLQEEYKDNPVGKLGTLRCYPWVYKDKVALIGDAAHAIVPFYGQGMNASFEDCRILNACIEKAGIGNWAAAFENYQQLRKENGDAIGQLAVENYYEMRDHVADPIFRKKRTLEHQLENSYEDYHSKYSLVTFQPEVPYAVALDLGNRQDQLLMELCAGVEDMTAIDLEQTYQQLKALRS